jgi:hypothetical protein
MPTMRDVDLTLIELRRIEYLEGDSRALLDALAMCFDSQLPIPPWVREGLLAAVAAVNHGAKWDDVFGSARERAKKTAVRDLAQQVLLEVMESRAAGVPVDPGLFEVIGAKIGVSGTKASSAFYGTFGKLISRFNAASKKRG